MGSANYYHCIESVCFSKIYSVLGAALCWQRGPESEPEPEVEAPAQPLAVQAMVSRFDMLHQGMEARHRSIRDHVDRLREIEMLSRTGRYDSDTPIRKA